MNRTSEWRLEPARRSSAVIGLVGLLAAGYGVVSAVVFSNVTWYSYFTTGATGFLGWINLKLRNESILAQDKRLLLKTYMLYVLAALLIELVGRFLLRFWEYPSFTPTEELVHVFAIGYPFAFFAIYESLVLIRRYLPSFHLSVIAATLLNALTHELPNTFAWEWRYAIPYVTLEILQINVVVIVGWIILVAVPLGAQRIVR